MSNELTRLEQQVRLAMEGEAWHGPAVLEVLAGVCRPTLLLRTRFLARIVSGRSSFT